MNKADSPWSTCLNVLDKDLVNGAISGCTYDMCALEGNQVQQAFYKCLAYELFTIQCNNLLFNLLQNPISDWRTKTNCPLTCGLNQMYDVRSDCPKSCLFPEGTQCGPLNPTEGCFCKDGFVLDSLNNCVEKTKCGCTLPDNSTTLQVNEKLVSLDCSAVYTCSGPLQVAIKTSIKQCSSNGNCLIQNNNPTCRCNDGYEGDGYNCNLVSISKPQAFRTIYMGCYIDAAIRNLGGLITLFKTTGDLTVQKCATLCNANGFTYFGLEVGEECYCGNSLKYGLASNETDCNYGCNGMNDQKCGGPWRVTVYQIVPGFLYEGDRLNQKEMLISQNGLWMAYLNSAGIFSIYNLKSYVLKWKATSMTSLYLSMQTDSNLVLYDSTNMQKWSTGYLQGVSIRRVELDNNGTLSVFDGNNKLLWSTFFATTTTKPTTVPTTTTSTRTTTTSTTTITTTQRAKINSRAIRTKYMGCYFDSSVRNLDGLFTSFKVSGGLTIQKCAILCNSYGYTYFGLEVGEECYCGDSLRYSAYDESGCYYGCNGMNDQKCGGPWRVTVYKIIPGFLNEGERLNQREMLISQNGLWMAYLNSAGIFSTYDTTNNKIKWTATSTATSSYIAMQTDSNLVLYDYNDKPKWSTGYLQGVSTRRVEISNDGTLSVYDGYNKLLWISSSKVVSVNTNKVINWFKNTCG